MKKPNPKKTVAFLGEFTPGGPWALMSIVPDGSVTVRTFQDGQQGEMEEWLRSRCGKQNLYFHVNRTAKAVSRKAQKDEIAYLDWLHVDLDPRPGEDIDLERKRALKLLQKSEPPPSCIIDSGGGYQAFWRVREPVPLDGTRQASDEVERYTRQLEVDFGADHCHNVDRVMRLPFTNNIPNKRKLAKGRVEAATDLVEMNDFSYGLESFRQAPRKDAVEPTGKAPEIHIGEEIERVASLEDLGITDELQAVIVQGMDPDESHRLPSRSEWVWKAINEMIRQNVPDGKIFAILMDPDFGISSHVLEQSHPGQYAKVQIAKAHDKMSHPMLAEMNERFSVIENVGNKCRVVTELWDEVMERSRISIMSFEDLKKGWMHRLVEIKTHTGNKRVQAGTWWLSNPKRRQYQTMVFSPSRDVPGSFNLWRGFAVRPAEGDCGLFLDHVRENMCHGDEKLYSFLLMWMARAVQEPGRPGEVAVVLRGEMGTGKTFFATEFGALFGRHYVQVSDPKHLVGHFNAHLQDCVILFGDEAFYAGDIRHNAVLKSLVTSPVLTIEPKGVDVVLVPNCLHIIMASNSQWVVPAGHSERRYFVLDMGEEHMQDTGYFAAIGEQMASGGREALLHHLKSIDISGFDFRRVPQTAALQDQKHLSLNIEEQWWHSRLDDGSLLPDHDRWEVEVQKGPLQQDYRQFAHDHGYHRKVSPTTLGKFLARAIPGRSLQKFQRVAPVAEPGPNGEQILRSRRAWFYRFPSLEECRAHFDTYYGGPYDWTVEVSEPDEDLPF